MTKKFLYFFKRISSKKKNVQISSSHNDPADLESNQQNTLIWNDSTVL